MKRLYVITGKGEDVKEFSERLFNNAPNGILITNLERYSEIESSDIYYVDVKDKSDLKKKILNDMMLYYFGFDEDAYYEGEDDDFDMNFTFVIHLNQYEGIIGDESVREILDCDKSGFDSINFINIYHGIDKYRDIEYGFRWRVNWCDFEMDMKFNSIYKMSTAFYMMNCHYYRI